MHLTEGLGRSGKVWLEQADGQKAEICLQQRKVSVELQFIYPLMPINA